MHHRTPTLIAVAIVLGTIGTIAACTGPGGSAGGGAGAAGPAATLVTVEAPVTLAQTAGPDTAAADPVTAAPIADGAPSEPAPTDPATTLAQVVVSTEAPAPPAVQYVGVTPVAPPPAPITAVGTADGEATSALQQRLLDLGFWLGATDGTYGTTTKQAVMAFQKYNLIDATGEVDERTAQMITEMPVRAAASRREGDLVEINKATQLLFIVRGGVTVWVINASTGNGLPYEEEDQNSPGELARGVALTPDGEWKVNRERAEGWWEGDLGKIYRPKYFHLGIAVHGSGNVPNYAASHGCVRVSTQAMDYIWANDLMPMKSKVWVHA